MCAIRASEARDEPTVERKADHIRINLNEDVSAKGVTSGFERYRFQHCALPEIDLDRVDTGTAILGRRLGAPLLISCMTGGVPEAGKINMALARVAQELHLAMGLGSGRVLLESPDVLPTFDVRPLAPDALLFANLGAVQLNRGVTPEQCKRLVGLLRADGLVLHLNALQEALQPEGDTVFGGLLDRIGELCGALDVPVIAKEVGWGISADIVRGLFEAGVAAVDVAGAGGTSWSEVEKHRMDDPVRRQVAAAFADWGLPTADALRGARRAAPEGIIFASGGLKDGMDVAKAVALGADLAGLAGPFLRAASESEDAAFGLAVEIVEVLRTVMFCTGSATIEDLRRTPRLVASTASFRAASEILRLRTADAGQFLDITDEVLAVVARSGIRDGVVHVFSNHTTGAIRINENEPLLISDFQRLLERLAPTGGYEHDELDRRPGIPADEPRNGHAHGRHLLLSSSETLPLVAGEVTLGSWQRIFFIELCSSRDRSVTIQVVGS